MDTNTTLQQVKDALAQSKSIGIAVGKNPTLDQMAAALSLYLGLKDVNKKASIAAPENPLVEISSLVGINKVQTSLGGDGGDLIVSFPYVEGEIEKVSYTQENGYLNIIVKAGENGLSFDDQDVKYSYGGGSIDVLFVVGTPQLADLGEIASGDKMKDVKIINIDIKPENQGYGDIVLISQKSSSISELVADLMLSLGFRIEQDTAQNLLDGIMSATKNFQSTHTSPLAFEIAALLMKRGAQRRQQQVHSPQQPQPRVQRPAAPQAYDDFDYDEPVQQPKAEPAQSTAQRRSMQPQYQDDQSQDPSTNGRTPNDEAPVDWLSPKVYKGSSNF